MANVLRDVLKSVDNTHLFNDDEQASHIAFTYLPYLKLHYIIEIRTVYAFVLGTYS